MEGRGEYVKHIIRLVQQQTETKTKLAGLSPTCTLSLTCCVMLDYSISLPRLPSAHLHSDGAGLECLCGPARRDTYAFV